MHSSRFVWQELITDDLSLSGEFYAGLLGWEIHQAEDAIDAYELIARDGEPIGAVHTCDGSGAPAHWLPFIESADVERSCAAAVAAGGDIIRAPHLYRGLGMAALLSDPDGALCMAIEPTNQPGSPLAPRPLPNWYAIGGQDAARTAEFYAAVFGFEVSTEPWTSPADGHLVLRTGETIHAGVFGHGGGLSSTWYHYFPVRDLDLTRSMATFLGGKTCTPPMTVPGIGRMAGISDPAGATFFVLESEQAGEGKQAGEGEQIRQLATAR